MADHVIAGSTHRKQTYSLAENVTVILSVASYAIVWGVGIAAAVAIIGLFVWTICSAAQIMLGGYWLLGVSALIIFMAALSRVILR